MRPTAAPAAVALIFALAGPAAAQIPGVPTTVPTTGGASAAAMPAPTRNLWSMLLPSKAGCQACKTHLCSTGIGKLMSSMMMPVSGLTGGMIGGICPGPNAANPADLAMPADSAQGAAARIKAEEAGVPARIAAVNYLSTVDCRYYPEATAALINSLRADTNECVRIAAAKAFLVGCCCNKATIAALTRAVNGDDKDGHPGERSECVKALAYLALQRCLACYSEPAPPQPEPGEAAPKKPDDKKAAVDAAAGVVQVGFVGTVPKLDATAIVLGEARATVGRGLNISRETLIRIGGRNTLMSVVTGRAPELADGTFAPPPPAAVPPTMPLPTAMPATLPPNEGKSLLGIWRQTRDGEGR